MNQIYIIINNYLLIFLTINEFWLSRLSITMLAVEFEYTQVSTFLWPWAPRIFVIVAIIKESNLTAGIQAGMLPLHQIINDICNLSLFINSQHLLYLSMLQQKVFNAYWISLVRGSRGTRTHNHWLNRPPL